MTAHRDRPLTAREERNLEIYRITVRPDGLLVADLAQNPEMRPWGATKDRALCTLTCSSSRLYVPAVGRCLSEVELLLAQGFPATDWAAEALGLGPTRLISSPGAFPGSPRVRSQNVEEGSRKVEGD